MLAAVSRHSGRTRTLSPRPENAEDVLIRLVIAEIGHRGIVNIHLGQHGPNRVAFVAIGDTHLDTAIEFLQPHAGAMSNRQPAQQTSSTDLALPLLREPAPVHSQTTRLMLSQLVKLQTVTHSSASASVTVH